MRTEKEMLELIINIAKADERIRAVLMAGSRAIANCRKDIFQDYDIGYVVNDVTPFYNNTDFIKQFGELLMLQMPELMRNPDGGGHFTYLMQFTDGNRIDLTINTMANALKDLEMNPEIINNPGIVLLDKDGVIPQFRTDDKVYHVKLPTENDYISCCNNFWWVSMYVAKGIWRDELPYAMSMYNDIVRKELHWIIDWYIGMKNDFSVSTGKCGKYYKDYLSEKHYTLYKATYSNADYNSIWNSLFAMCNLFRDLAVEIAKNLGFNYLHDDDKRVTAYLKHIKTLPKDAQEIY